MNDHERFQVSKVNGGTASNEPGSIPTITESVPQNNGGNIIGAANNANRNSINSRLNIRSFGNLLRRPSNQDSNEQRKYSLVQLTGETLPRLDHYRVSMRILKRPSIGELHGETRLEQMADNDAVARPPSPALSVDTPALEWLFAEPVTPSITTPTVASKPQFNCAICKKQHPLRFCRRFKSMDLEHRLRAVVKHRYCMRCLSASHISSKCLSNLKCAKCTDSHHFMLHDDDASRNRSKRRPKPRPLELTTASLRNSVRPVNQRAPSSNVVFPTCQLIIWIQGRPTKVRALLDQCSGMNYILQEFAVSRHFIQMPASDGQDVELVVSPTIDTTNRMRIVARVTNKMLRPTTSLSCPPSVRDHFKNLHLADPEFDQPGPLHMVLGMPVYNKVMKLNLLSQPGFPQAQDSIFGWVLSGICSM